MTPIIVVHGGAGRWRLEDRLDLALAACREAAARGQATLLAGGSALDAVEQAIRLLEDCEVFDARRGSFPNTAGGIEMDALIMDGQSLDLGAVAAVERVRNPISLARRVMQDTPHALLAGQGASDFADRIGFPRCRTEDLRVLPVPPRYGSEIGDTVGAVARDSSGHLATGTSTGGMRGQLPGRVGDSPLVGSGGYADDLTAAVSATGQGEALMKLVISKHVCDLVGLGFSAQAACEAAIRQLTARAGAEGGLIAVDARGGIGCLHNTGAMPFAHATGAGPIESGS